VAITLSTFVKLPKSQKVLFLTIILAVIAGLYAYLFYLPASAEIEKKKVDMGKLETQLRELRTVAENMKRFQADSARLREEVELAIAQLPTSKEIPSLLANISNLGKEAGLEFILFRPAPEVTQEFLALIPVEIKVKGTYTDVAIFFDRVSKMPRIVNISGVSMEGAKEVFGRWEITTSCTATTFKFIEKATTDLAKDKKVEDKKGVLPGKK
jgi:type IV pilus assembly protein PilO